jgi:hypothetical protein
MYGIALIGRGLGFLDDDLDFWQMDFPAPPSPAERPLHAPAIYVPARVVNISELPELQMFRCGVAFLPIAGTRTHT